MTTLLLRALLAALDPLHAAHCATERAGWRRASVALRVLWLRGLTLAADVGGYGGAPW